MDSSVRLGVASLVRQRGAGEISRETFFERLTALQAVTEPVPAPSGCLAGADVDWLGGGLCDSFASAEGHWQPSAVAHNTSFDSPSRYASIHYDLGVSRDAEGLHDWSAGPPLLTGEAARALILGTAAPDSQRASWGQTAPGMQTQPSMLMETREPHRGSWAQTEAADSGLYHDIRNAPPVRHPRCDIRDTPPLLSSRAWQLEPETNAAQDAAMPAQSRWDQFSMSDPRGFPIVGSGRWSAPENACSQTGQENFGLGRGPLPSTPPPAGPPLAPSPPASPARPSPLSQRAGGAQQFVTPDSSFANGPFHMEHNGLRRSVGRESGAESPQSAFTQRSELWERQRAQRCQELRRQRDARESAECSFRPNSAGQAGRSRSSSNSSRYARNPQGPRSSSSSGGLSSSAAKALAERLSRPSTCDRDAMLWREKREIEELQECTFQPDTSKSVMSRRLRASSTGASFATSSCELLDRAEAGGASASGGKRSNVRPPFVPLTNSVPRGMVNARAYLSEDVFSRLVQPSPEISCLAQGFPGGNAFDIEQNEGHGKAFEMSSLSRCRSAASMNESSFVSFLHRQNTCEEWRRERLDHIKSETAPTLRPQLCNRSVEIASRHSRRERSLEREGSKRVISGRETGPEPECSFKPRITKAAKQRERRSLTEMSAGDQRRREAKVMKERERQRALEMKDVSFSPHILNSIDIESRIQVLKDPDHYVERVARSKTSRELKCEQERKLALKRRWRSAPSHPK